MVIRMRHTRAHTANRRSHHKLSAVRLMKCGNCGAMHTMHRACSACGTYRGKKTLDVTKKAEKKVAKQQKLKAAAAESQGQNSEGKK